jgi:hypothetical protein
MLYLILGYVVAFIVHSRYDLVSKITAFIKTKQAN